MSQSWHWGKILFANGVKAGLRNVLPAALCPGETLLESRASIVIMPSRAEGFGLVELEAISENCPVLISSNSGLAKIIQEVAPEEFHNWVVTTTGDIEVDSAEWAKRIEFILSDRAASNNRMKTLYTALGKQVNWEKSVKDLLSDI